mmetsp:Transcript_30126/g.62101  ORF Transcript_30126/g.62101 Transcript_30126/m.62101 type:complete len:134 (-) Transcript_30126:82-483(-)
MKLGRSQLLEYHLFRMSRSSTMTAKKQMERRSSLKRFLQKMINTPVLSLGQNGRHFWNCIALVHGDAQYCTSRDNYFSFYLSLYVVCFTFKLDNVLYLYILTCCRGIMEKFHPVGLIANRLRSLDIDCKSSQY